MNTGQTPHKAIKLFKWQAIDSQGMMQTGEILADSLEKTNEQLFASGLQPVSVKNIQRLSSRYWKGAELVSLIRQLATLLQAGLPLVNSLALIAGEHPKPAWRCILREITECVKEGQQLSVVLGSHPQIFPIIYRQIIAIGEVTGQLERCCLQLAIQQEQQAELGKKVKKALRYPLIVCCITIMVTLLMLVFVLPEFAKVYASFDATLPLFTRGLLILSAGLVKYGLYLTGLIVMIMGYYFHFLHAQQKWQWREQQIVLRLPLLSKLVTDSCLSQIFQTLAMTQQAGMTLIKGLESASMSITNLHFQRAVDNIKEQLALGIPLHSAFSKNSLFPSLCQQLIRIGEESGALDELLSKLAQWHQRQAYELADNLSQTIEPLLMIVMGVLVGGLVIAMYLPIFQLGTVMG